MSGEQVAEVRPAEHHNSRRYDPACRGGPAADYPHVNKQAQEINVQRNAYVDRGAKRKDHENPVERVQQRRLKASEIRTAAKNVRIPQNKVALAELAEAVVAPIDELLVKVLVTLRDNLIG